MAKKIVKPEPEPKPEPEQLTEKMLIAIDALVAGSTQKEAAAAAGVERHTVANWQNSNPAFMAELNLCRYAAQNENVERLRRLGSDAVGVLERSMQSDDEGVALKAAAHILKTLGLGNVTPISPDDTDAAVVAANLKKEGIQRMLHRLSAGGYSQPEPKTTPGLSTRFYVDDDD